MKIEKIEYTGRTDDSGGLKIVNRREFDANLAEFFPNCTVDIIIKKRRVKRSLNQNAFLHVLLTIFAKELQDLTGDRSLTMQRVKNMAKLKFLKVDVYNGETGECIGEEILDTSSLTKEQMATFIEDIYRYAAETFHIVLPTSNTQQTII